MKPFLLLFLFIPLALISAENKAAGLHYFQSFDGTRIAYTDEGAGRPVILIHGFISNRTSWNNTAVREALLAAGFRVIIPDLRGNGDSGKPHEEAAYAQNAEIKDLLGLAGHLKLKKYAAVGYSRGAIVLAKLLTLDKRIKKAVLGGMGLDFTDPDWSRRKMFEAAFLGQADQYPETAGAISYAQSIGADLTVLGYLQRYQPVTSPAELAKLKTRVLVIAGEDDKDNGEPAELQAAIPRSQLKIVPGDHNNASKGTAFAGAVVSFLKK